MSLYKILLIEKVRKSTKYRSSMWASVQIPPGGHSLENLELWTRPLVQYIEKHNYTWSMYDFILQCARNDERTTHQRPRSRLLCTMLLNFRTMLHTITKWQFNVSLIESTFQFQLLRMHKYLSGVVQNPRKPKHKLNRDSTKSKRL